MFISLMGGLFSNVLGRSLVVDMAIQWGLWTVAAWLGTEKFYDLAGSGTFALLAWLSLKWGGKWTTQQKIQTSLVTIWATRLGLFLFTRVLQEGRDKRFDKVRSNPFIFLLYWTIQGLWVFMTLAPTLLLNADPHVRPVEKRDLAGWALWVAGFMLEVTADHQKSVFRANPDNAGKFIHEGLWRWVRHPNYLGEIVLWAGLCVSAWPALRGWGRLGVLSPVGVALLLTRISGTPLLEAAGRRRWGADPAYIQYLRNTARLVPYLW